MHGHKILCSIKILYPTQPTVMFLQASLQENTTNIADNEAHLLL